MAPRLRLLLGGLLCGALAAPLPGGAPGDAAALLQTSVERRGAVTLGEAFVNLLEHGLAALHAQMKAEAAAASGPSQGLGAEAESQAEGSGARPIKGFRFSRNETEVEEGSQVLMLMGYKNKNWADDDDESKACKEKDRFGSKTCKFPYGSNLHVKFAANIGRPVEEGSKMILEVPKPEAKGGMSGMIAKRMQPINVECPACLNHDKCHVKYMGFSFDVKVPPCPIPVGETVFVDKDVMLPSLPVLTSVDGRMGARVTLLREDGSTLGRIGMNFGLGPLPAWDEMEAEAPAEGEGEGEQGGQGKHHHHKHHR